jgi:hypothetical protein
MKRTHANKLVPWKRRGFPSNPSYHQRDKNSYQNNWHNQFANTGVSPQRLFTDEFIIKSGCNHLGVEERAFALFWDYYNNGAMGSRPLCCLYHEEPIRSLLKDRDDQLLLELVAQTTIQWLGTNCGRCFIDEVRKYAKADEKRLLKLMDEKRFQQDEEYELKMKPAVPQHHYDSLKTNCEEKIKQLQHEQALELEKMNEKHKQEAKEMVARQMKELRELSEWLLCQTA